MSRHRGTAAAALVVLAVFTSGLVADAAVPVATITDSATATATAVPVEQPFDAVTVYQSGALTAPIRDTALAVANGLGVPAAVGRGFSALMTGIRRGGTFIQKSSGAGWAFPMAVTALPLEAIGGVMGRDAASPVATGMIIMGQTTASLRGAQQGDVVDFVGPYGTTVSFMIGRIGSDAEVGGTEIVMTNQMADLLGAGVETRVLIYGQFDRTAMANALIAYGLYANTKVRVRTTWDPADPDDTMGLAKTKSLLGEFDFYYAGLSASGWTSMNATWRNTYLPPARETYPLGLKAMCNTTIKADLTAALNEVANTYPSLIGAYTGLDIANANAYGGCATGSVRFTRNGSNLGSVSRHSWGQPLDVSTVANCQGCVPKMDCRVVRIFRKHGFAWGGNFLLPDGMHFEWVGGSRNLLQYPSKYCPNTPTGNPQGIGTSPPPAGRDTLFANDGLSDE